MPKLYQDPLVMMQKNKMKRQERLSQIDATLKNMPPSPEFDHGTLMQDAHTMNTVQLTDLQKKMEVRQGAQLAPTPMPPVATSVAPNFASPTMLTRMVRRIKRPFTSTY